MKIPVSIYDELEDNVIESSGLLDFDSGDISHVKYINYDFSKEGLPALKKDYEFTCAIITKDDKEMEFTLTIKNGIYSVSPDELEELKEKSLKLFSAPTTTIKKRI